MSNFFGSLFGKKDKDSRKRNPLTPFRIVLHLAICGYLIFAVILPLIRAAPDEHGMNPIVAVLIIVVFVGATAFFTINKIIDARRAWKAGLFKQQTSVDGFQDPDTENSDAADDTVEDSGEDDERHMD